MTKLRSRGENIRRFILNHIEKHSADIGVFAAHHFGITRQAVNKHIQRLVVERALVETGQTRNKSYKLVPIFESRFVYKIDSTLAEDIVWSNDIRPILDPMPDNVRDIWIFGFTEMFNNAIDHSGGDEIVVMIKKTAINTEICIGDNGVGIFRKIQAALNLLDERHAVLELSKGKLTTDPKSHTGEGIFFTSRMFDHYGILSGGIYFSHQFGQPEDWILENEHPCGITSVWMKLSNHTSRTSSKVFDEYASSDDDYRFNKTVVPVALAKYGNDQLISRSQAKRLLARVELFKTVIFDFKNIDFIGQAFADEIFRVFANQHPEIDLVPIHTHADVEKMIKRAKSGLEKI